MPRKSWLPPLLATAGALLCAIPTASAQQSAAQPKKNVLFIISDDLNLDLGCYGHPTVKTPNIDRLAARGVRFDNAICQYPLCNPSRTSLVSGLRPDTTGVVGNDAILRGVVWMPEYFGQSNYFTARVGKIEHGADQGIKMINWSLQETPRGGNAPLLLRDFWDAQKAGKNPVWKQPRQIVEYRVNDLKDEDESDGKTARRIVELMQAHTDPKSPPFFLAAGLYRPHLPFTAPRKYFEMYPPEKIVLPKETEPVGERDDIPEIAFTRTGEAERYTDRQKREAIAAYYACITFMDAQVGVMLDGLEKSGLAPSTTVIFLGDHGFNLGEHAGRGGDLGVWRKSLLFQQSTRTPLIIAAPNGVLPGARNGSASKRPVEFVDIYPTLAELCGLPIPRALDGQSLRPLLLNPEAPWRPGAFSQVTRGGGVMGRSVHTERWRYSEWGSPNVAELYDLQADPKEYRNLARDPAQSATVAQMSRLLREQAEAIAKRPKQGVVVRRQGGGGD